MNDLHKSHFLTLLLALPEIVSLFTRKVKIDFLVNLSLKNLHRYMGIFPDIGMLLYCQNLTSNLNVSSMKNVKMNIWKKKGYLWVTLIFFLFSLSLHWIFGWHAFVNEQLAHNQPIMFSDYFVEMMRDTMENWQSEFLQLIWQVAGLSILLYVGSPSSKEGDERKEEKLDYIIQKLDPANYQKMMQEWNQKYPKK